MKVPNSWFVLDSGPGDAALNMAVDDALLEAAPRLGKPVLRFYGWTQRAASFGYFQRYSEIEKLTELRPLVRRPTGGGLVPHDADWTYSLVFPAQHKWHKLRAVESYQKVHLWLQAGLARLGLTTELAPCCQRAKPGQCFAGYEQSDLLWHGAKIAGAAQRRTRQGLLIQGSVQPAVLGVARNDWQAALSKHARCESGIEWLDFEPDELLANRAAELAREKYGQAGYNQRR